MYRFKTKKYADGLFAVDAAYVIHLENNGRLPQLTKQLETTHVADVVHVLYNAGYKKVAKDLPAQTPAHDLVHAYKHVFLDAREKGYDRVLVLEDDFFFRDDMGKAEVDSVNAYLKANSDRKLLYQLGCSPGVMMPVGGGTYLTASCGTHACVYTRKLRDYVLDFKGLIRDWDWFMTFHTLRYAYSRALCYQLYPDTDNSNQWMALLGYTYVLKAAIRFFMLNTQAEPGYSICYWGAKLNGFNFVALSVLVVYYRDFLWSLRTEKIYSYIKWVLQELQSLRSKATPTLPL